MILPLKKKNEVEEERKEQEIEVSLLPEGVW